MLIPLVKLCCWFVRINFLKMFLVIWFKKSKHISNLKNWDEKCRGWGTIITFFSTEKNAFHDLQEFHWQKFNLFCHFCLLKIIKWSYWVTGGKAKRIKILEREWENLLIYVEKFSICIFDYSLSNFWKLEKIWTCSILVRE